MTVRRSYNLEDVAVWADGSHAAMEEVERGECSWKSDDFEIVRYDDDARLAALGIDPD